jgi:hypothetical protein
LYIAGKEVDVRKRGKCVKISLSMFANKRKDMEQDFQEVLAASSN